MGVTTIKQRRKKIILLNKLTSSEFLNERELRVIEDGMIDSLIPLKAEKNRNGIVIKGKIIGLTPLQSVFNRPVSKNEFINIVSQIIAIIKECERNLMNVNNLMLDFDYLFFDTQTGKVKCVFWPIINNQNVKGAALFFRELPFRFVFTKNEDHSYIEKYLQYLKNIPAFHINSFEKLINQLSDNTVSNNADSINKSNRFGQGQHSSNNMASHNHQMQANSTQQKVCEQCSQVNSKTANYCINCGYPLYPVEEYQNKVLDISEVLGIKEASNETINETINETTVLVEEELNDETTVLGAEYHEPIYPYLVRERTQEKIIIDKPVFRIGKEKSYCDYFVANNNAVSRSHADIISRDGRYFIIDNNSTNKTYVNGQVVPVQQEIELFPGTKIKLANEEFIFYI